MVTVYALLCAASVAGSDCAIDNAIDVIELPKVDSDLSCLQDSMVTLAQLAIQPNSGEYWKIVCKPPDSLEPILIAKLRTSKTTAHPNAPDRRGHEPLSEAPASADASRPTK